MSIPFRHLLGLVSMLPYFGCFLDPTYGHTSLTLRNNSPKPIARIEITFEEGKGVVEDIGIGKTKQCSFDATGENSYSLLVFFADGTTVSSSEKYVEGGYNVTESIESTKSIADIDLGRRY